MSLVGMYTSVGGRDVGHYRVLELIGHGGMGEVYKADDTILGRTVALKFLPAWKRGSASAREGLIQEARYASALNHPNIVTVHEIAEVDGVNFIVMEYLNGDTLDRLIPADGLPEQAYDYGLQIADALAAAHDAGILHGDLKPRNIMITHEGRLKILDFGLAGALAARPLTSEAVGAMDRFGTTIYMAPEQLGDPRADPNPRSEIFSFGLILDEMLCGAHPFGPGQRDAVVNAILNEGPKPLPSDIAAPLVAIVQRCLEKNVERRFQSMRDVLGALKACSPPEYRDNRPLFTRSPHLPTAAAEIERVRSIAERITYKSVAKSRQALAELESLIEADSAEVREAVTSALKDVILTVEPNPNGVPGSVRGVRKRTLDVLKRSTEGDLAGCFKDDELEQLDLYGMDFASSRLTGLSFVGCFLVEASFEDGDLAGASFVGSWIRNARFRNAVLSDVDMTDADWFNASGLTETQLAAVQKNTLMECPSNVEAMHRQLEARYAFSFKSWPERVQEELKAAWENYLCPGGLRDIVTQWRHQPR